MKRILIAAFALSTALFGLGCNDDDNPVNTHVPLTPQGVYSITGDQAVYVYWNGVYDTDVSEYLIYRSPSASTGYVQVGQVDAESNPNLDLLLYEYVDDAVVNGTTYYYAVASVDRAGRISELSAENVFDTPRPEGNSTLFPVQVESTLAGLNLSAGQVVAWNSPAADIQVDRVSGIDYINAANVSTNIMDMGLTASFDEISVSPSTVISDGWSAVGYYEATVGHTYVVWTSDNHFAKLRVSAISGSGAITFHWGYQTDTGNPELVAPQGGWKRPYHEPNYPQKFTTQVSASR
ncbi:MAG: hypothetical protein WAU88_03415 [Candidatus Zixiibacteriota bacterium]